MQGEYGSRSIGQWKSLQLRERHGCSQKGLRPMARPRTNSHPLSRLLSMVCLLMALLNIVSGSGHAQTGSTPFPDVGIEQKLNAQVPLELSFRNETGDQVEFQDLLRDRPVILNLVY